MAKHLLVWSGHVLFLLPFIVQSIWKLWRLYEKQVPHDGTVVKL